MNAVTLGIVSVLATLSLAVGGASPAGPADAVLDSWEEFEQYEVVPDDCPVDHFGEGSSPRAKTYVYKGALNKGQIKEFTVYNGSAVEIILTNCQYSDAATWKGMNYNGRFRGNYIKNDGTSGRNCLYEWGTGPFIDLPMFGKAEVFLRWDKFRVRNTAKTSGFWLEYTVKITR